MSSFLYALNIGTLATWLTLAGASSVACVVKVAERLPDLLQEKPGDTEVFVTPMALGSAPPAAPSESLEDTDVEEVASVPEIPAVPELPEMPDLPEMAELEPLPDIPELPKVSSPEGTERPRTAARTASTPKTSNQRATAGRSSRGESGGGSGSGNGSTRGSGSSPVGADRWVGGRMPKPSYPSASRRAGQQGRVVVQFTVDERGYVVDAKITSSCPFAPLNEEALRTVRRWKFRPGPRATASRPIVFQLN
jgi:protein TonB